MRRCITSRAIQRAFSLTELVVVLAVTALIASIGASAYRTYVVRGQIAASLEAAKQPQARITKFFQREGQPPSADVIRASNDFGPYVDSMVVVDGRIDLHFGTGADAAVAGRTLSLTPFESANRDVLWLCGNRVAAAGLHPLGFANGARQAVQVVTQIEPRYLPSSCR